MVRTPSIASTGTWALLMLTVGVGAVRHTSSFNELTLKNESSPLSSAGGPHTSDKYKYNPLDGIKDKMTLIKLLKDAARENGNKLAFRSPHQDAKGNLVKKGEDYKFKLDAHTYKYDKTTWQEYHDKVMTAAAAFIKMGLKPMDAVNIRGVNSEEWLIAFMGCIAAGGLPVGLYPTDSPAALEFKAEDSGAAFIVLGRAKDLDIYSGFLEKLESVKAVILWDSNRQHPEEPSSGSVEKIGAERFLRWRDFMGKGDEESRAEVDKRIEEQKPGQAGTVVYTSGTTGNPKGVMLSQDSVAWSARTIAKKVLKKKPPHGEFRIISFLPLNHVAGQMLDILGPLYISSQKGRYVTVFFPAMCYLKKTCSAETLGDTKPVIFLGVPEVWDGLKLKLELAVKDLGKIGQVIPWSLILKKLGMNKVMYAISGAGPIRPDTIKFFKKIGIKVLNIFGQSESSALGTAWTNKDFEMKRLGTKLKNRIKKKFGSIGRAIGNDLKLDETLDEDGKPRDEIMLKGRNVMLGYLNRADKTQETINSDGWLMTGDKGTIDTDGFVFLTGRLKEIMKIQGEMIAPVAVEQGILKSCNPSGETILKQVIVVGDGKLYISVLITLVEDVKEDEKGVPRPTGDLVGAAKAVDNDLGKQTVTAARASKQWADRLSKCIGAYNTGAAKPQERVHRYIILPKDITAEDAPDLMTPTFKIKRDGVNAEYEADIEKCYGEDADPKDLTIQPC